jgi:hypothetical protein
VAIGLTLAWSIFTLALIVRIVRVGAAPPLVSWPLPVAVALALVSAMACGAVAAEICRGAIRSSAAWSDKRHFTVVLLVGAGILTLQALGFIVALRMS